MVKKTLFFFAICVFVISCTQNQNSPLYLTILQPHDGDTVKALVNPVSGKTYPQASVTIGFDEASVQSTLVPDDTGRFAGTYTIPTDNPGPYSVYIKTTYQGLHILETRTINYVRP